MFDSKCVFCKIIQGLLPSHKVREWDDAIAIVPLAPVTGERFLPGEGHVLVMPKSISSQSQSLGTGGPSKALTF